MIKLLLLIFLVYSIHGDEVHTSFKRTVPGQNIYPSPVEDEGRLLYNLKNLPVKIS